MAGRSRPVGKGTADTSVRREAPPHDCSRHRQVHDWYREGGSGPWHELADCTVCGRDLSVFVAALPRR